MLKSIIAINSLLGKAVITNMAPSVEKDALIISSKEDVDYPTILSLNLIKTKDVKKIICDFNGTKEDFQKIKPLFQEVESLELKQYFSTTITSTINADNLKSITIPDSIEELEYYCFSGSSITNIDIKNVKNGGYGAFYRCKDLKSITATKLTSIPDEFAMECSSLESVTFGDLTSIGNHAFMNCINLKRIDISKVSSIKNMAFQHTGIESISIPVSCISIGEYAFSSSSLSSIIFATGTENEQLSIGVYAFSDTRLTKIEFPSHLTSISKGACSKCGKLTKIVLSDKITTIPEEFAILCVNLNSVTANEATIVSTKAFKYCVKLEKVSFGTLTRLNSESFMYCSNVEIRFSESEIIIFDSRCLAFCNKISISFVLSTWNLNGESVFMGCSRITELTINTSLYYRSFKGCKNLKSVTLLENTLYVYSSCFRNCSNLSEFKFSSNLTNIADSAFAGTKLSGSFDFTDITIGELAFESTQIESVTIGNSISGRAFLNCTKLKKVEIA